MILKKVFRKGSWVPPISLRVELCEKLGMDGFGYHFPMGGKATAGQAMQAAVGFKESYYYPQKVTFDFVPPWIAEMGVTETGRTFIKRGLLTSNDSLKLFDEYLA